MALQTHLDKIKQRKAAYDEAVSGLDRGTIAEGLGEVIPEGFVLTWTGYTPSFNDGDPCRFTIGGAYLVTTKEVLGDYENPSLGTEDRALTCLSDEDDTGYFELGSTTYRDYKWAGLTKKADSEVVAVFKLLDRHVLERAFGDGVRVVVHPGGKFIVDDFDCGH